MSRSKCSLDWIQQQHSSGTEAQVVRRPRFNLCYKNAGIFTTESERALISGWEQYVGFTWSVKLFGPTCPEEGSLEINYLHAFY